MAVRNAFLSSLTFTALTPFIFLNEQEKKFLIFYSVGIIFYTVIFLNYKNIEKEYKKMINQKTSFFSNFDFLKLILLLFTPLFVKEFLEILKINNVNDFVKLTFVIVTLFLFNFTIQKIQKTKEYKQKINKILLEQNFEIKYDDNFFDDLAIAFNENLKLVLKMLVEKLNGILNNFLNKK